jgi:hypothetical protein
MPELGARLIRMSIFLYSLKTRSINWRTWVYAPIATKFYSAAKCCDGPKANIGAEPILRGADAAATAGRISAMYLEAHTCLQNMEARHASYTAHPGSSLLLLPALLSALCGDVFAASATAA